MESVGVLSMEMVNNYYSRKRGGKGMAVSLGTKDIKVLPPTIIVFLILAITEQVCFSLPLTQK